MKTIATHQNHLCAGEVKNGWRHIVELVEEFATVNKQRANLIKLRHQIGLERKCVRDIGMTQLDLIWAYSSQIENCNQ